MMELPPGEPVTMKTSPCLSNTIVGDMDERGRLPPPGAFATGLPFTTGGRVKSVSWLFKTKPLVQRDEPKALSTEAVNATALPAWSTIDRCVVPGAPALVSRPHMSMIGLPCRMAPGSPGAGASPGLKPDTARELTYLGSSRSETGTVTLFGSPT